MRRSRCDAPAWGGLLLVLALGHAPGPAGATALVPVESAIVWERAGWDPGSKAGGEIQQSLALVSAGFVLGARLDAELEVACCDAARSGAGVGAQRAAALLRYRGGETWMVQAGLGTPSTAADLEGAARKLAAVSGDPLFALPDPDPARGWRFHASGVRGVALSRGARLLFGLGGELASSFSPARDVSVDPADRFLASAALQAEGGATFGQARLSATLEGGDEANGALLRRSRTLIGLALSLRTALAGVAVSPAVEAQRCERVSLLDPETYGARLSGGPGTLLRFGLGISSTDTIDPPLLPPVRPFLDFAYARLTPRGLPASDGWTALCAPGLAFATPAGEIEIGGGWGTGSWRQWDAGGQKPAFSVDGWRLRFAWVRRWSGHEAG